MAEQNKVSIVIQAIDRATATVKAINGTIARMAAPARASSRALGSLLTQTGYARVSKAALGVGKSFDSMTRSVRNIATASAVAIGALGGMYYALTRITNAGESAVKAAQSFGTTVPEWQKLAYAAEIGDVAVEDLGQSLGMLNKRAVAAATGNQQAATWFRRAGLSVKDQNGNVKSSTQLFAELADRFEGMPDGPKKLALANALLKDSQGKLIPLLNGGSKALREAGAEAVALGLIDEQLARDSAIFNDEMKKTNKAVRGVGNVIAAAFLPVLNELLPAIRGWIVANRALIGTRMKEFVDGLKQSLPQFIEGLANVFRVIMAVASAVNRVVQFFGGWQTVIYAVAAFMGAKLVLSILAVAKAFFVLGVAILTTPIGWIAAGMAVLATIGYFVIKHWDKVKVWFLDFIKVVLNPVGFLMKKIIDLVPGVMKGVDAVSIASQPVTSPVAATANARNGMQQFGGQINLKIDGAPARVTKMESSNGLDINVDSGLATAGGY